MPLDTSRIRAICFDVDGTLRDTDDQYVLRLAKLLRPLSFIFPRRDPLPFARRMVMATESPATFLFGLPDRFGLDDELSRLGDYFYRRGISRRPKQFLIIGGVQEMISTLHPQYPLAIVSARGAQSTVAFLEAFGLIPYFRAVATSQTCTHTKPYPDPVLWAAEQMKVSPTACLMVGDTTVDIRAGKAAGAQTAGLLCGFGEEGELCQAGADVILSTTSELTNCLGCSF